MQRSKYVPQNDLEYFLNHVIPEPMVDI